MNPNNKFSRWIAHATEDEDIKAELKTLVTSGTESQIEDCFYRDLKFGTGGLRGVIGAGTNRMNIYTVRKATQGLAEYLLSSNVKPISVAIAYDSRHKSTLFAKESASVLAANGIDVYIYPELMPTPALSFAVRNCNCAAGICITASHNPAKYNGYKVYGSDGCQITLEAAKHISGFIEKIDPFDDVKIDSFEKALLSGKIKRTDSSVTDSFLQAVLSCRITTGKCDNLKVVYTPLNGAGLFCVTSMLEMLALKDLHIVPEQQDPNGDFPTCPSPNPEVETALQKGLELAEKLNADLLLATDPDCDRVGIAVKHGGEYFLLTGNEVGVLLLDFIAKMRIQNGTMPKNPIAIKTIVTTDMAVPIAAKYGVELRNVLTGFKFIGEQIGLLEQTHEENRYIFGFEESYGYLSGTYVRDKDAVNASMLICEIASFYKHQNKTLVDALEDLYREHGYYINALDTITYDGAAGAEQMCVIMDNLREKQPETIGDLSLIKFVDYLTQTAPESKTVLPLSNILEFHLSHNCKVIIRPSGTEPKMKLYFSAKGKTKDEACVRIEKMKQGVRQIVSA